METGEQRIQQMFEQQKIARKSLENILIKLLTTAVFPPIFLDFVGFHEFKLSGKSSSCFTALKFHGDYFCSYHFSSFTIFILQAFF